MTNLEYMMAPCCPEVFKDNILLFADRKCSVCEYWLDYDTCVNSNNSCHKGLAKWFDSPFDEQFWDELPLISME